MDKFDEMQRGIVAGSGHECAALREVIEKFIRWTTFFASHAGSQWADGVGLSQECHWLNETIKEARAALAQPCPAPHPTSLGMVEALKIATGVFDQYKTDQPKWWKRMEGTPILNDVAVRMAQAFCLMSVAGSEDTLLLEYWYANPDLYFMRHQDGTVALHTSDHDFMRDPEVSRGKDFRDALRAAIRERGGQMITAYGQTLSEVWLVNTKKGPIAFVSESDATQYAADHELTRDVRRVPLYETRAVPDQKIAEKR